MHADGMGGHPNQKEFQVAPRSSTKHTSCHPPPPEEDELHVEPTQLLDLEPGMEIVALPGMDVSFNADYLTSQEDARQGYSSCEGNIDRVELDTDMDRGGGLEEILWPPELLLQAEHYEMQKTRSKQRGLGKAHRGRRSNGNPDNHAVEGNGGTGIRLPAGTGTTLGGHTSMPLRGETDAGLGSRNFAN